LFSQLPPHGKVKNRKTTLWGESVYLSTRCSYNKRELVAVVSNRKFQHPFKIYRKRWEIEPFFDCLKKRRFCLEDTDLIHASIVLTIALCWSHLVGEAKQRQKS